MAKRLRGRAAVEQRARRIAAHPVCAECAKRGLVKVTVEIDHVVPLEQGGTDDDDNIQGLCLLCHALKTAVEGAGHGGAQANPAWLKPSGINVDILCGPPLSGRFKMAAEQGAGDKRGTIIAMSLIISRMLPGRLDWSGPLDPSVYGRALRARNAMLGALAQQRKGWAWVVLNAPTEGERAWWEARLGERATVTLLNPGRDACRRRALELGLPAALPAIDRWFEQSRLTWSPGRSRLARVGFGADGYPIGG